MNDVEIDASMNGGNDTQESRLKATTFEWEIMDFNQE
jgi:hypothetical protein